MIIDAKTASKMFGIDLTFSLGVYDIENKNTVDVIAFYSS